MDSRAQPGRSQLLHLLLDTLAVIDPECSDVKGIPDLTLSWTARNTYLAPIA